MRLLRVMLLAVGAATLPLAGAAIQRVLLG